MHQTIVHNMGTFLIASLSTSSSHAFLAIITLVAATILLLLAMLIIGKRPQAQSHCHPLPPGTTGLPFVGETFAYLRTNHENKANGFVKVRKAKYGDVFKTSLFFERTIVLDGAEANRFLYTNEGKLFREAWPTSLVALLGANTLVALSGTQHKRLRRVVMSCLYPEALQNFVATVDDMTQQQFIQKWQGQAQVSLYRVVKSHTLDVASLLLVGVKDEERRERFAKLFNTFIAGLLTLPIYLPWTTYYKAHAARAGLEQMLKDVISERRKEMEAGQLSVELKDLVSTLITAKDENGKSLTEIEILDVIITLLFAGHDTNSSTISFVCKYLCENQTCYEEVLKEQMAVAESKKHGEKLRWDDFNKMKFTWKVIQETLRMEPPVTGGFRVAVKDSEYGGFRIPSGWKVYNSISRVHLDDRYFPNPMKFDPSRFVGTGPAPYTYLPFGAGPHTCVGIDFAKMVMLVFVHHLVRRFKWTVSIEPMPIPVHGISIMLKEKEL